MARVVSSFMPILLCILISRSTVYAETRNGENLKSNFHSTLSPSLVEDVFSKQEKITMDQHQLCKNYTKLYLQELKKFTLWAAQMYDSTAKVPEGILAGDVYQFGSYDSCVGIDVQLNNNDDEIGGFRGKYCLARVQFAPLLSTYPQYYTPSEDPYRMTFEANGSAWEKIKFTGDRRRLRRDILHWGVCVPSVCGTRHITAALEYSLRPLEQRLGLRAVVSLPESMCSTSDSNTNFDILDIFYGALVILVALVVLICTSIESFAYYQENKQHTGSYVVQAFSVRANWVALGRGPASREAEAGDLRCIHGLRFFSMLLIILGHRCMFSFGGPLKNPEKVEQIYTSAANMLLLNGPILVDTFFVISGFLTCYLILLELDKRKALNVPLLYLYRYIRLTPVYAAVIGFYATFLNKMGEGPLWTAKVGLERERCRVNWWANLLYVNNYVNTEQLCLFQSWFLACDMHYFLLAPLIVYPLWRWPRAGKTLLISAAVLSVVVPFAVTLMGGLDAVLLLFMSTLKDPVGNDTFRSIYIPSHTRAGPYFIGMLWGYVFYRIRVSGTKVSKRTATFLFFFLHAVAFSCVFGAWAFYVPGEQRSAMERALYAGLHRAGWGICIGWLIIACSLDVAGPYRALLSWKPLVPLSRLTYCAFLVHSGVQLYETASMRTAEYMNYYKLFWMTTGDITVTFGLALVLYLMFEAPVSVLEKIFLRKDKKLESNLQQTLPTTITCINQAHHTTCRNS